MKKIFASFALLASALTGAPAIAAETIDLTSGNSNASGSQERGEAVLFDSDVGTVTVSAWTVTNRGTIRTASVGVWSSGIGVKNSILDTHTIDNLGWTDFILLQFETAVALANVQFNTGYNWMNDTDATIGFGVLPISDISSLDGEQWPIPWLTTFESGSVGKSGSVTRDINPNNEFGNVWLIGASFENPDIKKDGFKIASVEVSAIPEPATWLMFILGLGLLGAAMRNTKARAHGSVFAA
ncbi:MAG: PEPxxWA-CTERM sorting domain-containing protein [Pseudomonadota bacterium]